MSSFDPIPFADRIVITVAKRRSFEPRALRAFLKALSLLGLAFGVRLAEMRDRGDPIQVHEAEKEELRLQLRAAHQTIDILQRKLDKIAPRHRPHYDPESRFHILSLKYLLHHPSAVIARTFRISPTTISRWEADLAGRPDAKTIGSLIKPTPPLRRYADVVRRLVQSMASAGFPGSETIARTLARVGWKMSKRTVGRIRKERLPSTPTPQAAKTYGRSVKARYPNHVLMTDLTEIPSLFRIFSFKLAVVLDVFSRMPLAAKLFENEPSADGMARLVRKAVTTSGNHKHFVSDRGAQFTASIFRWTLARLGLKQRFGAIGQTGSIALIERLWRTLNHMLRLRFKPSLCRTDLEGRIEAGLLYYAYLRPHQGLGGATPAEVYFGIRPAHHAAVSPPRGRLGEGDAEPPFAIAYLDPDRHLPFLIAKAA
jgi:transposase InsO family protein